MGKKRLWSVFTDNMDECYYTQNPYCERHHIYYGPFRKKSEIFGYIMPLASRLHRNEKGSVHDSPNSGLDLELKKMAQEHFEANHGTEDDFIREFGMSYKHL